MPNIDIIERATARTLRLDPRDDVAVALEPLQPGARIAANDGLIGVRGDVPYGHKVALRDMAAGETVRKFGWPIGRLTAAVSAGEHVHSHNLATLLSGVEGYAYAPLAPESPDASEAPDFLGYRRADGRVATRNEIWILPTVGCVGRTAQKIAAAASGRHAGKVDGIHAFAHIVERFLALYVHANSFTRLVMLSRQTGEELLTCDPRSGDLSLL